MKSPVIRNLANQTVTNYFNRGKVEVGRPSPQKLICLNCPLPVSKCKFDHCKRYIEELNKLKEKSNV